MSIMQSFIGTNLLISGGGEPATDFTIEWFQNVENNFNNARPWSVGLYPTQIISISYEGMTSDYYWINNSFIGNVTQNHLGQGWRHMAFVRRNQVVYGYINGTQYFTTANSDLITNTATPLYVGTGEIAAGTYQGYITNLHIMKGVAKYTGNFVAPVSPIASTTGSVFLMNTNTDGTKFVDSVGGKTATVEGNPTWTNSSPFLQLGPYSQFSNMYGTFLLDFSGENYNYDLFNVKTGWDVTDGFAQNGFVTVDAFEVVPGTIRIGVSFNPTGIGTWTFTQPGLGSIYFDGSSYLNYGASVDWAMDVV